MGLFRNKETIKFQWKKLNWYRRRTSWLFTSVAENLRTTEDKLMVGVGLELRGLQTTSPAL